MLLMTFFEKFSSLNEAFETFFNTLHQSAKLLTVAEKRNLGCQIMIFEFGMKFDA